jgi:putative flippase GtrA
MRGKNDVFDRLMSYSCFDWFRPFYNRYKEFLLYALFGLGTVLISIGSYALFTEHMDMGILVANAISWVFATLFAFLTNRAWVFTSHVTGAKAFLLQLGSFSLGRFATLLIEEWMLYFFVGVLQLPNMTIKFIAQIVVIALNYLISKLIVFRRKK